MVATSKQLPCGMISNITFAGNRETLNLAHYQEKGEIGTKKRKKRKTLLK